MGLTFSALRRFLRSSRPHYTADARRAFTPPRRAARLLFRDHIENGAFVALCLAVVALTAGGTLGFESAAPVITGALCVSIVDRPGRLGGKAAAFLAAIAATTAISLCAALAGGSPWVLAMVVAAMSAGFALVTVYGRPAITLGIAAVLSLALGMAAPVEGSGQALLHSALFLGGGAFYAVLALGASRLLEDRGQRLFLNEALLAFANFLHARARSYEAVAPNADALRDVLEAHGVFMERLQAARNAIFIGRPTSRRRNWVAALLALLDAYEAVLSSDADWQTVPRTPARGALRQIAGLARAAARDVEALSLSLVLPSASRSVGDHARALSALDGELDRLATSDGAKAAAALWPTRENIAETLRRIRRIGEVLAQGDRAETPPPDLDLSAFVQVQDTRLAALRAHMTLSSPVARYAIRLTLAMLAAFGLTVTLPAHVHGGWILLTVALIMRASYALTIQRRNDRILGTLVGCGAAAVLIPLLPEYALLATMIVAAGVAHAYATVNYRLTSFAASVMALLLLHLLQPSEALVFDRVIDTLIGAALSVVFSRLLPSWEWRDIPRLVGQMLEADRSFARQALTPTPFDQAYRLARKRALDCFTALATTTRRLAGEPVVGPHHLASLDALLGAAYLFASDLLSVRSLLRLHGGEIASQAAGDLLDRTRSKVLETLDDSEVPQNASAFRRRRGRSEPPPADAATSLQQRLGHVEAAARQLKNTAARALAESTPSTSTRDP